MCATNKVMLILDTVIRREKERMTLDNKLTNPRTETAQMMPAAKKLNC